jgi:DUF4097 and DUF4098 domain-containing protein YvlB
MYRSIRFHHAAALLLAILAGTAAPASRAGERTAIHETRALAASGKLSVNNIAGTIVVRGWDRNEVAISGTLGEDVEKLDISGDAGHLSVVVRYPSRTHGNVDDTQLELRVPARAQLSIDAVSADVQVSDSSGDIDAKSVSGDVRLDVGSGRIKASTVSGDLSVRAPSYQTTLNSVSGDLTASGVRGSLSADTVSGDLSLDGGRFTTLKLQSVSGDLNLQLDLDDGGTLNAETLSGDIELRLPKMPDAKLTMKTFSGELRNGFAGTGGNDEVHTLTTTLGSGKGEIDLHSFSGDIDVSGNKR